MEFKHKIIARICEKSVHPEDAKAILNVIKAYLTEEQIVEINKNVQKTFDQMCQTMLDNPEDFGLI